jgi:hypothetical protein
LRLQSDSVAAEREQARQLAVDANLAKSLPGQHES